MSPKIPGDRLFENWLIKEVKDVTSLGWLFCHSLEATQELVNKGGQRCHLSGLASLLFSECYPKGQNMTAITPNAPI